MQAYESRANEILTSTPCYNQPTLCGAPEIVDDTPCARRKGQMIAGGTTLETAPVIDLDIVLVSGADGTNGVRLSSEHSPATIWNRSYTHSLNVYPTDSASSIDELENGAPFELPAGEGRNFGPEPAE